MDAEIGPRIRIDVEMGMPWVVLAPVSVSDAAILGSAGGGPARVAMGWSSDESHEAIEGVVVVSSELGVVALDAALRGIGLVLGLASLADPG